MQHSFTVCNAFNELGFLESKLVQCTQDNSMIARRVPLRIVLFNNEECLQMKQTGLNMTGLFHLVTLI